MNKVSFRVNPFRLLKIIAEKVYQLRNLEDDYFWDDRFRWEISSFHHYGDMYRSNRPKDKYKVLISCCETIAYLTQQILRFGRFPQANKQGHIYNFPDKEVPSFYINETIGKYRQNTLKENLEKYKNETDKIK